MGSVTKGSCLCGEIQYELHGEFDSFFLCHCKYCQKDSGSAHGANLFSKKAQLIWTSGEENVTTFNLPNSRHNKSFCKNCGSPMPIIHKDLLAVPAGSIDGDFSMKPTAHIFVASKACWEDQLNDLKKFETFPEK